MANIISANYQHIPIIQSIANQSWHYSYAKMISSEQIKYMLDLFYNEEALKRQMNEMNHQFIIAMNQDNPLGFASYQLDYNTEGVTKLHKLYNEPEALSMGIGRLLVNSVIQAAKDNNQKKLMLNVNRNNEAIGFYKKMSFEIIGEEDIDIGEGYFMNDYIMELSL